ncbi:hypothetical protein ACHAPT_005794 [Fusarium lateritium]
MTTNPAPLPELVRDSKLEATTFQDDLTIHTQPLGRRRRTEKWRRREILGHGGYGVVWLEHKVDDDDAAGRRAVKVVRNRGRGPVHYVRELEALAKFSQDKYSDFFVKFLGWYENPQSDYLHIAMEYCPHGDLKKYLAQNRGRLPENEVKDIASQVLAGVLMMHRAGFANRDIKPANILIKSKPPGDWWVKICDFGLSKRAEGIISSTTTVRGTPEFMPPEALGFSTGPGRTDAFMVDMWCLGETVFQALAGQPVFGMPAAVGRYLEGSLGFPVQVLHNVNASTQATSFIMSLMSAWPRQRMTSEAAIRHPWMHDMTPDAGLRVPETPSITSQSSGNSYQYIFPSSRAPGDQLTQASGQWTTTMTLPNQPPPQQQGGFGRGNPYSFPPFSEAQPARPPYYNSISPSAYPPPSSPGYLANPYLYYLNYNPNHQSPYPLPYRSYNTFGSPGPRITPPNNLPSSIPHTGPPVAPSSAAATPSGDFILDRRMRRTSVPPAPLGTSRSGPSPTPLVRRKTKAIDISKCSILSHIKTIRPPPGRNWDHNDGLIPSWDTPLTWHSPSDDRATVGTPSQPVKSTKVTSSVEHDVLKEFKDFAAKMRLNAIKARQGKPGIDPKVDREVKIRDLKKFAATFKLPTPHPGTEAMNAVEEVKVAEEKQEPPIEIEQADIPAEWTVIKRRRRGRK